MSEPDYSAFRAFEHSGWEAAAEAFHDLWGALTSQSVPAVLDAAKVGETTSVLDVACGAGYLSAGAAARGAAVTGADFSAAQVALARRLNPAVPFVEADAAALPFETGRFDAVVMGFGANHLPDPQAAFAEAARVLRPGGIFAFTVWAQPAPGTGFGIVLDAIARYGAPVELPPAPDYFQFADPDIVASCLTAAGLTAPATKIVPQFWRHNDPSQWYRAFAEGAVRASAMLKAQPESNTAKLREVIADQVIACRQADEYVVPVPASLSWARKD